MDTKGFKEFQESCDIGLKSGDKIFVSYLDEHSEVKTGYYIVVGYIPNLLILQSDKNEVLIPIFRIIKIKKQRSDIK